MASARKIRLGWSDVVTTSASNSFHPASVWLPADGLSNVKAQMELRGSYGTGLAIVPAYQLTNDPRNPDAATVILIENDGGTPAGYANGDGFYDFNTTVTNLTTTDRSLIRFGWIIKVSSGTGGGRVCSPKLIVTY